MTEGPSRFFFVHLQKTAGTALFKRLRHAVGVDAVYPLPDEQGTPETVLSVDRLRERLAADGDQFRVVTGHFPLATVDRLGGTWSTFTVLRDPVERVLSFLRHQREVEERFACASLEEIYEDPVATGNLVANHMVKMLSMTDHEMTDGALSPVRVDEVHVARAKANLADRIDVVGLQEHFDEFCIDLERSFGWDLGDPLFMNRTKPAAATDALRRRIADDNAPDLDLYGFARDLWAGRHPGETTGPDR